jgi:dienelactone hydrolase
MQPRVCRFVLLAIAMGITARAYAADGAKEGGEARQTFTVPQAYNQSPFDYQMTLLARRAGYRVYHLTYPSPVVTAVQENNTVPGEIYLPDNIKPGDPKRPAVICLHILDGNMALTDLMCSALASRGIPAIMFRLPYYGERSGPQAPKSLAADPRLFVEGMHQAEQDIRRAVDLLGSRPEIDSQRIGITGISLGGIVSATVAGAEPRLHRACLILAGGGWWTMLHHARETASLSELIHKLPAKEQADLEAKFRAVDPLTFAPALRERAQKGRVLMINAAEDEVIPRACTEKLAQALGISERVIWLQGLGHYTTLAELPRALRTMADFFAQDLPAGAATSSSPPAAAGTATQRGLAFFQQALAIAASEPDPGRCHFVDIEIAAGFKGRNASGMKLRFVRGAQGKFALKCSKLPKFGDVWIGQGEVPWMVAGGKEVFKGTKNPLADHNPLAFVDPQRLTKLRMIGGLLGSLALVPDTLSQLVAVEDVKTDRGGHGVRLAIKQNVAGARVAGSILVSFQDDGSTPAQIRFQLPGSRTAEVAGEITIHGWQVNAVAEKNLFAPPANLPIREVIQADLYRVFSAVFDLVMEQTE